MQIGVLCEWVWWCSSQLTLSNWAMQVAKGSSGLGNRISNNSAWVWSPSSSNFQSSAHRTLTYQPFELNRMIVILPNGTHYINNWDSGFVRDPCFEWQSHRHVIFVILWSDCCCTYLLCQRNNSYMDWNINIYVLFSNVH